MCFFNINTNYYFLMMITNFLTFKDNKLRFIISSIYIYYSIYILNSAKRFIIVYNTMIVSITQMSNFKYLATIVNVVIFLFICILLLKIKDGIFCILAQMWALDNFYVSEFYLITTNDGSSHDNITSSYSSNNSGGNSGGPEGQKPENGQNSSIQPLSNNDESEKKENQNNFHGLVNEGDNSRPMTDEEYNLWITENKAHRRCYGWVKENGQSRLMTELEFNSIEGKEIGKPQEIPKGWTLTKQKLHPDYHGSTSEGGYQHEEGGKLIKVKPQVYPPRVISRW